VKAKVQFENGFIIIEPEGHERIYLTEADTVGIVAAAPKKTESKKKGLSKKDRRKEKIKAESETTVEETPPIAKHQITAKDIEAAGKTAPVTLGGLVLTHGGQIEFAYGLDGLPLLAASGTDIAAVGESPVLPPSFWRFLSGENFSSTKGVKNSALPCEAAQSWLCPFCETVNSIGNQTCKNSKCGEDFPQDDHNHNFTFKIVSLATDDDETDENSEGEKVERGSGRMMLKALRRKWQCPKEDCKAINFWTDLEDDEDVESCTKCNTPRPDPHDLTYTYEIDHQSYTWIFTRTNVDKRLISNYVASSSSKDHHTAEQLILQGDQDFDKSVKKYSESGGICPFCTTSEKGCRHPTMRNAKRVSFSTFYGLTPKDKRYAVRMKQLQSLLNGAPPCACQGTHGGVGAIPKAPYNVFSIVDKQTIDPNNKYWNNNVAPTLNNARSGDKVKTTTIYETLPGVIEDPQMKCHIVPRSAGGCFRNPKNVIFVQYLCWTCQCLDKLFTLWQSDDQVPDDTLEKKWLLDENTLSKLVEEKLVSQQLVDEWLHAREDRKTTIENMINSFKSK
jgi:hypothetical protein